MPSQEFLNALASIAPSKTPAHHAAPHSSGGGGITGFVEHLVGKTASNLESAAINAPAGLYHLAGGLIHHPIRTGEQLVQSEWSDLKHPLRNPGYTLLDALGLAGGVGAIAGRAGELGRVAAGTSEWAKPVELADGTVSTASTGSQLAKAALLGPKAENRFLSLSDSNEKVPYGTYSKNVLFKAGQKQLDTLREAHPDAHLLRTQRDRVKVAQRAQHTIDMNKIRDLPASLVARYKGLSKEEFVASRVIAEGASIPDRIKYHEEQIASGELKPREIKESRNQIDLLRKAEPLIENRELTTASGTHVLPFPKDENSRLAHFVNDSRVLAHQREQGLIGAGMLTNAEHPHDAELINAGGGQVPEGRLTASSIGRILGPKNVIEGRGLPVNLTTLRKAVAQVERIAPGSDKLGELKAQLAEEERKVAVDEHGVPTAPEGDRPIFDEELANHLFRVPYAIKTTPKTLVSRRFGYEGGKTKAPSSVTHAFQAAILKRGGGRLDLAHVNAESYLEAHRFLYLKDLRQKLFASSSANPEDIPEQYRVPMLADWRKNIPVELKMSQDLLHSHENPTWEQAEAGGRWYDQMRKWIFHPTQETAATNGVRYIDKRMLGGLDDENPLLSALSNPTVRKVVKFTDAVNEGQKAALLYLKPAYLIPNALGNVALNLVQQGFLAPLNLARATVLLKRMDPGLRSAIRTAMGGGLSRILEGDTSVLGKVTRGGNFLADKYGKLIDDPFRFSAFIHEARSHGFSSNQEIDALIHNPKYKDDLNAVTSSANDAIINYERLGPGEQAILRRLIFFYPWVKGSSRYAFQFTTDHPVAAGGASQTGKEGEKDIADEIGKVPSFAEGLIPYGAKNKKGIATVGNPSSFSILQTPAQIAEEVGNLVAHRPNRDLSVVNELSPVDTFLTDLATLGQLSSNKKATKQSAFRTAAEDTFANQPVYSLLQHLTGTAPQGKMYPHDSKLGALSRFALLGGLTPRQLNTGEATKLYYSERNPHP